MRIVQEALAALIFNGLKKKYFVKTSDFVFLQTDAEKEEQAEDLLFEKTKPRSGIEKGFLTFDDRL